MGIWNWSFKISFLICLKLLINSDPQTLRYYHSLRRFLCSRTFYIWNITFYIKLEWERPIVLWYSAKSSPSAFMLYLRTRQRKNVSCNRKSKLLCFNESSQWFNQFCAIKLIPNFILTFDKETRITIPLSNRFKA